MKKRNYLTIWCVPCDALLHARTILQNDHWTATGHKVCYSPMSTSRVRVKDVYLPERTQLLYPGTSGHCQDKTSTHYLPVWRCALCRRWRFENLHRGQERRLTPRYRLPLYAQRGDQCDRKYSVSFVCLPICKMAKVDMASPPVGVLAMVSTLATKTHKTLHYAQTDETMVIPFAGLVFPG